MGPVITNHRVVSTLLAFSLQISWPQYEVDQIVNVVSNSRLAQLILLKCQASFLDS